MAKIIKILAASVGSGLVLGAGIRLGGAIASRNPATGTEPDGKLAGRLSEIEGRLRSLEGGPAEPECNPDRTPIPRGEIPDWLEKAVTARLSEIELRLRAESEQSRKQLLDAVADQIQTRMIQRISKLEEKVAGQSAAMSELRECSLRTERSIQKLLGGLDKLIVRHLTPAEETAEAPSGSEPLHPPVEASAA